MVEVVVANRTSTTASYSTRRLSMTTTPRPLTTFPEISVENSTFSLANEREQIRAEFFRTYDVMTGVRIAATLGGFFGLMVLLVIYKSLCKTKSLSDENLNAAAAAVVEEEDNEIAATLEAAAYFSANPRSVRGARLSLGNMSAPAMVLTRGARFSSIGGYTSLEPPACYYYQRGKSLPGSALRFTHQESYCEDDELDSPPPPLAVPDQVEEDLVGPSFYSQHLTVPAGHSRRLSSITCSSADSSYLERKGSACELGLPPPPPFAYKDREKRYISKSAMIQEPWDFYYPIDIQVIQPTPDISPCGSERTLYDDPIRIKPPPERTHGSIAESISSITIKRLAPLASISTYGGGALSDFPDDEQRSVGSDSVFFNNEIDVDTEDEVEGFDTDSDEDIIIDEDVKYRQHSQLNRSDTDSLPYSNHFLQVPFRAHPQTSPGGRWSDTKSSLRAGRRVSVPSCRGLRQSSLCASVADQAVSSGGLELVGAGNLASPVPGTSRSCERLPTFENPPPDAKCTATTSRPPYPLPGERCASESVLVSTLNEMPCRNELGGDGGGGGGSRSGSDGQPCFPMLHVSRSGSGSSERLTTSAPRDENNCSSPPVTDNNDSWSQETLF